MALSIVTTAVGVPMLEARSRASASQGEDSPEAAVRAREAALASVMATKDAALFDDLVAADFTLTREPAIDKAAWVEELLRLCGGGRVEMQNLQVVVRGDVATASFTAITNREPSCQPPFTRSIVVDVWIRSGGIWRLALRNSRDLEPPIAAPLARPAAAASPPRWAGSAELTALSTAGNVDTFTLGFAGDFAFQYGPWRTNGRSTFVRTVTNDEERARSFFLELRETRTLTKWIETFGRALYQRDRFAGIVHRYGGDAGFGLVLTQGRQTLRMTLGVGSTREVRVNSGDAWFPIASAGGHYRLESNHSLTVTDDVLFTNSLTDSSNWRAENTAAIAASLRRPFSLKLSYAAKYLNRPVPGFGRVDTILAAAVVAKF